MSYKLRILIAQYISRAKKVSDREDDNTAEISRGEKVDARRSDNCARIHILSPKKGRAETRVERATRPNGRGGYKEKMDGWKEMRKGARK